MYQYLINNLSFDIGFVPSSLDWPSLIAIFSSIAVLIVKNPIESIICLIMVYGFISVFLMLVGLTFIGFSYMIVYIGAVSILFLFILMLIDVRTSELQINNWNSIPLATLIVIFLNYSLTSGLPHKLSNNNFISDTISNEITNFFHNQGIVKIPGGRLLEIFYATSNNWDTNMTETSHISTIGNILYTSYNIWLLITSIILLLAMVGAIVITIKAEKGN